MKWILPGTSSATMRRGGFTLIEILVVMAILGILAAILIPAVQAAREVARRNQCANNLKQFGLALNNYVSMHTVFPLGSNGSMYSFHTMLLPHLEQSALFDSINFSIPASLSFSGLPGPNFTSGHAQLNVLRCPSDPQSVRVVMAQTNYPGNGGISANNKSGSGLFVDVSAIGFRDTVTMQSIADGTSNSLAATEWAVGQLDDLSAKDPLILTYEVPKSVDYTQFEHVAKSCNSMSVINDKLNYNKSAEWLFGGYSFSLMNTSLRPNANSCTTAVGSTSSAVMSAGSRHSRGVNSGFIDGHVRFVRDSIALPSWRALSTVAGNDIADEY